jgi:hypothetical protein
MGSRKQKEYVLLTKHHMICVEAEDVVEVVPGRETDTVVDRHLPVADARVHPRVTEEAHHRTVADAIVPFLLLREGATGHCHLQEGVIRLQSDGIHTEAHKLCRKRAKTHAE